MNNIQKIGSFLLLSTLVLGTAAIASASQGENKHERAQRPSINQDVKAALEAGDYEAFVAAHPEDSKILEDMTEERFEQMLEIHELIEAGDREGAQALREEYGLEGPRGNRPGRKGVNPEIKAALEAGDYEAFVAAHPEDSKILEDMTEERFEQMLEIHELIEAGDREGAQALREEYGLERPQRDQRPERQAQKVQN